MDIKDLIEENEIIIALKIIALILLSIIILSLLLPQDTIKEVQSSNIIIECKVKQ